MEEVLANITDIIEWYNKEQRDNPHDLIKAMRKLTTNLYTLETYRADYKKSFETVIFNAVKNGDSVARASNKAEIEVSELYMLRRIMEAAYRVSDGST